MARLIHRLILTTLVLGGSTAVWAEPLKAGSAAPAVVLKDQSNKAWSLGETLKRPEVKAVLLYFTRRMTRPAVLNRPVAGAIAEARCCIRVWRRWG